MGTKISGLSLNNNYFGLGASGASTLFGSLQTNDSFAMSSMLSDYTSIRNGSYAKLLNKYYGNVKAEQADSSNSTKNKTRFDIAATALSDVKNAAVELNKSIARLTETGKDSVFAKKDVKKEDGTTVQEYDKDAIMSAVSSYVKNYNATMKAAGESGSNSVKNSAEGLNRITGVMTDRLAKIGISRDVDGMLKLDEDTFMKADMNQVKSLMNGSSSYAAGVGTSVKALSSVVNNQMSMSAGSIYGNNGAYISSSAYVGSLFNGEL